MMGSPGPFLRALGRLETAFLSSGGMTLPLGAIGVIAAGDMLLGESRYISPMMVVAPALAALTTTWRSTLVVGVVGALVQLALLLFDRVVNPYDQRLLTGQAISYTSVAVFSVYLARLREGTIRRFAAVTSVAEAAQRALLRPPGPRVGCVSLAVRYASAADAAQIGGDLYAVLDTPHGVRALVGDVRGKGLDAVQASSVVMGAFREAAYDEGGLGRAARRVDASVCRNTQDGEFATALFAEFGAPGSVELLHYGHVAPLRVSRDGSVTPLDPPEPWVPLGLSAFVAGSPRPWQVPLAADDVLVLCTDGVVEARNTADGAFYPLAERAGPLVAGAARDLERAAAALYEDLLRHTGGPLADDAVLLLLSRPE